jgi:phosphodiesterase/alkaline phosphatase D-like protein
MNKKHIRIQTFRRTAFGIMAAGLVALFTLNAEAAVSFLGVAAGDATSSHVTLWTRAVDNGAPANTTLTVQITTDPAFVSGITPLAGACTTDSTKDFVCKAEIGGLGANTVYYYRFVEPAGGMSNIGRVKTAPDAFAGAPVHFAFSGDYDGLIRPYALASVLPDQKLDFYVSLGDVIYETASNLTTSGVHNGESWLNSGSVTLSGSASNLNGIPASTATPPFATSALLKTDYEKKYRENFLPVNTGGQNSLQVLYASQGNYTTWDNHELGNRQYINGGAPAGGSVGGVSGTDMNTGRGVDARDNGTGNPGNVNDVNNSQMDYMNRSTGFMTLRSVFLNYQPMTDRHTVNAPTDPRTDGTVQLYFSQPWGKNAILITTDTRSYRDLRIKTANGSADDTGPRADNTGRTYLGKTQLDWLKQTLLAAQNAGTPWKFIVISDPIDQLGPIGGALTLLNLPNFGPGGYAPVNTDGGKSYMGGYRAERNDLLKFIADNHIINVVFMATDDHQNRINELAYSPTGQTAIQTTYVKVPYVFSIVAGPLGATGPDLITNHTFVMAQQYANSIFNAQQAAGVEPLGLIGYPGLHDLVREGDPMAGSNPQAVDFYSPDTFNFTVFDVSADGKTLTVRSIGMDATAQNAGLEYNPGPPPQARELFSFKIDTALSDSLASVAANVSVVRSGLVLDRRTNRFVQQVTLKNEGTTPIAGSVALALDSLSANATLAPSAGITGATTPGGSPLALADVGSDNVLSPGESATIVLQFLNPTRGAITYNPRVLGSVTP